MLPSLSATMDPEVILFMLLYAIESLHSHSSKTSLAQVRGRL